MYLLTFPLHAILLGFFTQFSSTLSLPFQQLNKPAWLGKYPAWITVLGEVEWTDNNVRGHLVVRNVRNVTAMRPGKPSDHWFLWAGASRQCQWWCQKLV